MNSINLINPANSMNSTLNPPPPAPMPVAPAATLLEAIARRARHYADAREELAGQLGQLQAGIEQLTRERLPALKRLAARTAAGHAELAAAVESAPELFEKPRTVVFHGIKVGYRKSEGRIEYDDAEEVVRRIQQHCDQPAAYLRIVTQPDREALAALPPGELRRLGCRAVAPADTVLIKPVAGDVEKQITALLKPNP